MNIQKRIDLRTIIDTANRLDVACTVDMTDDGFDIVMNTGEVEPAVGVFEAIGILEQYAQRSN